MEKYNQMKVTGVKLVNVEKNDKGSLVTRSKLNKI